MHEQTDAVLLSHTLAEAFPDGRYTSVSETNEQLRIFMDLLTGPATHPTLPVSLGQRETDTSLAAAVREIYGRFGNNNFVIHSHLDAYAHGVFPLASRVFNHSCTPNAVTRYIITPSEAVRMEVIALRDIAEGEEVRSRSLHSRQYGSIPNIIGHNPLPGSGSARRNSSTSAAVELRLHLHLHILLYRSTHSTHAIPA